MSMPTPAPTPTGSPNVNIANSAVKNHPEIAQKAPSVLADAIASGNPDTVLTTAATQTIAPYAQAVADHINNHQSQSIWASITGGAKDIFNTLSSAASKVPGVSQIMQWANKPLQSIQQDYKFLHSVYTDHSVWQGVTATLGVIGGGVGGALVAGPMGAVAGAEAALAAEDQLGKMIPNFKDSVAKSKDPNYLVSPGRDVANALGNIPGFTGLKDTEHGWGQTISGVTDAAFDFKADPLLNAGKINSALKSGKYVAAAVDDTGKTLLDAAGKPQQIKATLPIAAQSQSINNFMLSYSGKAYSASQIVDAYANPLNTSLRRAINTIADMKNPIEIQNTFPRSEFTTYEAEKLAKASTPEEVVSEMGKSLYSAELVGQDAKPRGVLVLPTQTAIRAITDKGLEKLKQQGTNLNEERNLLLPKSSTVVDEAGNPKLNPDGSIQKQTLQGGLPVALAKLGMFDISGAKEAALNALAGKVRTFTGYKALVLNDKSLELSSKNFDWDDPQVGPQIYNMARYSMPHDLALEHTAKLMLEPDLAQKQFMYGNLVKEVVKNAGLPGNDEIVAKVMSQAQRATDGGELATINYGHDHRGTPRGYVDMQDGGVQGVALRSWQQGGNAFIDFKELRKAMRSTTIHGLLYQKYDDFWTYYTDKVFAPLTLFSTGFGLRVASSEALHQVVRAGLGDYLKSQVAQSAAKYNILHGLGDAEISRLADSAAQALTDEDTAALTKDAAIEKAKQIPSHLEFKAEIPAGGIVEERWDYSGPGVKVVKENTNEYKVSYVSKKDGKPDAWLAWDVNTGEIKGVYVNTNFRNSGIATSMLEKATKLAEENGIKVPVHSEFLTDEGRAWKAALENKAANAQPATVTDNAVTKLIRQKADIYKSLSGTERANELATDIRGISHRFAPIGFINSKMAPYVAADKLDVITKYQQLMGAGKGLPAGVASDHGKSFQNSADERVDILAQLQGHTAKPTEDIASLTGTDPHFHKYWAMNLSKSRNEIFDKNIAADYKALSKSPDWNTLTNDEKWSRVEAQFEARVKDKNQYKDLRPTMVGLSKGVPASFANEVVSTFRGMVEGASGKIHDNLIDNIAKGKRVYESDLKQIPVSDSPYKVLGKSHKPSWSRPMDRVLDVGYRTFINPIIDHVSREPIFAHYLYENFRDLKPMIDAGHLTEDEALRLAGQKATSGMIPLIHNPALRSQMATMSRNILPFYFAQEQAMKRIGRVGLQDGRAVQAFREFQMIQQGLNNPSFVHTDSTGKQYIVYPMVGEFGNSVVRGLQSLGVNVATGMPESVIGNTASLATVLPELKVPGISPMGNIVLTELGNRFPEMTKAASVLTGGYPATGLLNTLLPNSTVRDVYNGLTMDQKQNAVSNAILNSIASAYFHGIIDDKFASLTPAAQQAILDKIENNAKTNLFLQGFFSFFLPLAPNVSNVDYNKDLQSLRSEFQNMVKPKDQGGMGLTMAEAQDKFLASHGNQAVSYAVGFTKTKENGASVPLSQATVDWLNNNGDIMKSHPNGAAYLIPQNTQGGDVMAIEHKLLAMEIRSRQTPADFTNAIYVSKGWADLGQDYKDYQAAIKQAKATNNITQLSQISQAWNQVTSQYGLSNPIWYASYKDPTRPIDAQNALSDLQAIRANGKIGSSDQSKGITSLLDSYNDYHAALSQVYNPGKKTQSSIYYNIQDAWNAYLDEEMTSNPNLTNVINGVFRRVS